MFELNPTYIALISALLGGSGLKVVDFFLNRSKTENDTAAAFRTELRDEVKTLRDRADAAEKSESDWRAKYYELVEENILLKTENAQLAKPKPAPRPRKKPAPKA